MTGFPFLPLPAELKIELMSTLQSKSSAAAIILHETEALREQLLSHALYEAVTSPSDLQIFMQHHVFAVCDFMWLVKRLQNEICGTNYPWTPPQYPLLCRFVNEIVLGEECDEDGDGGYCSHFELYLKAMQDVESSSAEIGRFIDSLNHGVDVPAAVEQANIPESVRRFVLVNHELVSSGSAGQVAAAFCFGREDIIPDMFIRLLDGFHSAGLHVPRLQHYIERHIELDGDHHGPLAHQMVDCLCGDSDVQLQQAIDAANAALTNRIALWDGVVDQLSVKESAVSVSSLA